MDREKISRLQKRLDFIEKIIWNDEDWEDWFKGYFRDYCGKDEIKGYAIRYAYDLWGFGNEILGEFQGETFYSHAKLIKKYKTSLDNIEELYENISPFFEEDKEKIINKIKAALSAFEHLSSKRQRKQLFLQEAKHVMSEAGFSATTIKNIILDFSKYQKLSSPTNGT